MARRVCRSAEGQCQVSLSALYCTFLSKLGLCVLSLALNIVAKTMERHPPSSSQAPV